MKITIELEGDATAISDFIRKAATSDVSIFSNHLNLQALLSAPEHFSDYRCSLPAISPSPSKRIAAAHCGNMPRGHGGNDVNQPERERRIVSRRGVEWRGDYYGQFALVQLMGRTVFIEPNDKGGLTVFNSVNHLIGDVSKNASLVRV